MKNIIKIWVHRDRVKYIVEAFSENRVKIGETSEDLVAIEIELSEFLNMDMLNIFHAGIRFGTDDSKPNTL